FKFAWRKFGIFMVHGGIVLLLLGQLFSDVFSRGSAMRLTEGETKFSSESDRASELAIVDITAPDRDSVVAIPASRLQPGASLNHPRLPFTVRVVAYASNSDLVELGPTATNASASLPRGNQDFGARYALRPLPNVTQMTRPPVRCFTRLVACLGTFLLR